MRTVTSFVVLIGVGGTLSSVPARAAGVQSVTAVEVSRSAPAPPATPIHVRDARSIAAKWGIAVESLRLTASGYMLDFRYRVIDAGKAKPIFERKIKPLLRDEATGAVMAVPVPPKTGALRNSNDPKAGRSYFMFFANPAHFIKAGNTVTITIGAFSISGLRVGSDAEAPAAVETAAQSQSGHEGHGQHDAGSRARRVARTVVPQPAIRDVALVDHDGRQTSLRELLDTDKPVLVNFIFTSCTTICPVMTTGFAQLQDRLGVEREGARLVSISIDPEIDTVETLRSYAARYQAGESWRFLTGTSAAVEAAQRAFGAYRGGKNNHAPVTFFRLSPGSPWQAIDGLSSGETLLRAYRGELPGSGT
jgi:protein SCO1/2